MKAGVAAAVGAYVSWGLLPLYFRAMGDVPADQVLAHRIVWALVFVGAIVVARRDSLRAPGAWATIGLTSVLLGVNWLLYVWAVFNGHVLDASLGYFVNPLVSVLLGRFVLGERLTRAQLAAIGLAAAGVAVQVWSAAGIPWVSLALAGSFGLYGLLRTRMPIESVPALFLETALMTPFALAWLATRGAATVFGAGGLPDALFVGTGVVTAVPLLFFGVAARTLRLTTLGLLQYISPTLQFACGVWAFGEPFTTARAVCFALIWAGLGVYSWDMARGREL